MTTAHRIRAIIARTGWSQARVAFELGVPAPEVSLWLAGRNTKTVDRFQAIFEHLDRIESLSK